MGRADAGPNVTAPWPGLFTPRMAAAISIMMGWAISHCRGNAFPCPASAATGAPLLLAGEQARAPQPSNIGGAAQFAQLRCVARLPPVRCVTAPH